MLLQGLEALETHEERLFNSLGDVVGELLYETLVGVEANSDYHLSLLKGLVNDWVDSVELVALRNGTILLRVSVVFVRLVQLIHRQAPIDFKALDLINLRVPVAMRLMTYKLPTLPNHLSNDAISTVNLMTNFLALLEETVRRFSLVDKHQVADDVNASHLLEDGVDHRFDFPGIRPKRDSNRQ